MCFAEPKRLLVSGLLCAAVLLGDVPAEPKLISVFPSGGQAGSEFEIRLRGTSLEGAYAAWFDAPGLSGVVEKVAEIESPSKKDKDQPPYEVVLTVAPATASEKVNVAVKGAVLADGTPACRVFFGVSGEIAIFS